MFVHWMILAAALGQTTQPAIPRAPAAPRISVAATKDGPAPTAPRISVAGKAGPATTVPERRSAPTPAPTTTRPASEGQAAADGVTGELTGDLVGVQVTSDNSIILTGNQRDLEILGAIIEMMDQEVDRKFKIFALKSAQATDLAIKIQQLWDKAKQPASGKIRPEDRVTIMAEARANVLIVAATEENLEVIGGIIEQLDIPSLDIEHMKFVTFQLKHVNALEAEQILRDMLEKIAKVRGAGADLFSIQAVTRTNTLMVSATEQDLEQVQHLIELIDVPPTPESGAVVKLAVVPLQKAVARDLAETLTDMLQIETDPSKVSAERVRQLDVTMRMPDGTEKKLKDLVDLEKPIKVFAEMGVNALVIASVESNLDPLVEMVGWLDSVPLADDLMVEIFRLQYADAESLREDLQDIFDKGEQLPKQPGREEIKGRIPPGVTGEALAYEIGLSVDKRTNALIVSGRLIQLLVVKQIVAAVDVEEHANRFPIRMIKLEHADVRRVKEVGDQLAEQWQEMVEPLGRMAQEREKVLLIDDVRTNSLIIVAKEDNYNEIAELAQRLDRVDEEWLGDIRIINLDNLTAADIADKIEQLWERRAELRREGNLPEDKPVIVTDSRSNSLVIASNREDYAAIERLVAQLEQQRLSPMMNIRQVILKHNDASKMADMLQQLFEKRLENSKAKGEEEQPSERIFIVADPLTNTMLIVSSQSNYDEIVSLVTQLDVPPPVEGIIRTFYVKNIDVAKAAEMIDELFDKGIYRGPTGDRELPESLTSVTVIPDIRSSALIVSASPENYAIVEKILTEIDRLETPILPTEAQFFQIRYADVVNVGDLLTQMLEGMRDSLEGDEQDQLQFDIIPETRGRRLIVVGTRFAIQQARLLVEKLDQESASPSAVVQVYQLKEQSAVQLEEVMTELFEEQMSQDASGERTPVVIIPDGTSNSLVVTASQDDHRKVKELVALLDVPSPMAQQVDIIPLAEAKAEQIADTLTELLDQQQQDRETAIAVTPELRTNSLVIWAPRDLMANIREIVKKLDTNKPTTEMALRVFKLFNARADELSELLNEFFEKAGAGEGDEARQMIIQFVSGIDPVTGQAMMESLVHQDITISADKNTNALLVMAPKSSIDMMQMMVEMLDSVEPTTAEIRVFELYNADATEMKDLLDELFVTGEKGGDEERVRLVLGAGGVAGLPGAGEGGRLELAFSVDERTNSLIAAGSASYLKIVEDLVYRLDYREIEERIVRVERLRYRKASEVAEAMSAYFEEESGLYEKVGEEAATRQLQRQVTIQTVTQEEEAGDSNILLISCSPRMESTVIQMINELDQPIPQVMIQVLMAEVSLTDRFELGMEFAMQDLLFSERAVIGQNGVVHGDAFDFVFGTDIGAAASAGVAGMSFTVTGEDFNFLLRALQTEGRLEVLSRPSIMVQDGQEAEIIIGEDYPTVTDFTVTNNTVTPVVSYRETGIKLKVLPIINPDGYVNLEIEPEISDRAPSSVPIGAGLNLPVFTKRTAITSVTVKDQETIIIGGLITSREEDTETKVPLVGDIPLVGNLFKANTMETRKTELLIVLTPHVVRVAEDAQAISLKMRDQTGLMDNVRRNPLMGTLQSSPEEDQLGPAEPLRGSGQWGPDAGQGQGEQLGPELEEYGPAADLIQIGPERDAIAIGPDRVAVTTR